VHVKSSSSYRIVIRKTASIIATSTVHSKLDYCNSLQSSQHSTTPAPTVKTVLLMLLSRLLNSHIPFQFSNLSTG